MTTDLKDVNDRNWVKACLVFRCLKAGLVPLISEQCQEVYRHNLTVIKETCSVSPYTCTQCNIKSLKPYHEKCNNRRCNCQRFGHHPCPQNGACGIMYDLIMEEHSTSSPDWSKSCCKHWSDSNLGPWEMLKCFANVLDSRDADTVFRADELVLIQICRTSLRLRVFFGDNVRHLDQVLADRNFIMHSANFEVSQQDLNGLILHTKGVLSLDCFVKYSETQQQLARLAELENDMMQITDTDVIHSKHDVFNELTAIKRELKRKTESSMELRERTKTCKNKRTKQKQLDVNALNKEIIKLYAEIRKIAEQHRDTLHWQQNFSNTVLDVINSIVKSQSAQQEHMEASVPCIEGAHGFGMGTNIPKQDVTFRPDELMKPAYADITCDGDSTEFDGKPSKKHWTRKENNAEFDGEPWKYSWTRKENNTEFDGEKKKTTIKRKGNRLKFGVEPKKKHLKTTGNDDGNQTKELRDVDKSAPNCNKLRDICKRVGRKSPELKSQCEIICSQIRLFKSVRDVYAAFKAPDETELTFVIAVDSDMESVLIKQFLYDRGIGCVIKDLQIKNDKDYNDSSDTPIKDTEIKRLRKCIRTHSNHLLSKHQYLSIIKGCIRQVNNTNSYKEDQFEARLALYVLAKGYIPIDEEPFEKNYDGIQVDVREGVFIPFSKHADERHDNIRMGCKISRFNNEYGTLGVFFEHRNYGMCAISSAHLLMNENEIRRCKSQDGHLIWNQTNLGNEVYQVEQDYIGRLVQGFYKEGDADTSGLEIGIIQLKKRLPDGGQFPKPRENKPPTDLQYSSGRGANPQQNNLNCVKFGYSTEYTGGKLVRGPIPNVMRALPWTFNRGNTELTLYNQFEVAPISGLFANFGDSGAPVFVKDGDGELVCIGMVAGGITDSVNVMVTPITVILKELGISKLKSFRPNFLQMAQDISTIKTEIRELAQQLLQPNTVHV